MGANNDMDKNSSINSRQHFYRITFSPLNGKKGKKGKKGLN